MHAGNIFTALISWLDARLSGGTIVLRMEDIDPDRSRRSYADQIMRDFEYLGLPWDEGPYYQSDRQDYYREALAYLDDAELLYPCFCSRADIHTASAPHEGEVMRYAGTCRNLSERKRRELAKTSPFSLRVKVDPADIRFTDRFQGVQLHEICRECGDVIVRRSDGVVAYNLAVVVDDARMGITSIVRGCDLLDMTALQVYLQTVLGYTQPTYAHAPLIVSETGKRLAKRDSDAGMDAMIDRLGSARAIIGHLATLSGMITEDAEVSPDDLVKPGILDCLEGKTRIVWRPF